MRRAPMIVCLTLCLCACGDETQSGTSAVTTQEDTPSGDTQLSSDSGEENAGQDNNATGSAPPDNAASDMTETATVEPPPTPALECPEVGLDASAGALYYVCDCGSGADTDCVPGDDGNDGSQATPWRSYDAARQAFGQTLKE